MSLYRYVPHPRIAAHERHRPRTVREQHKLGFNGTLARSITEGVGTMWCAYAFGALALVALPQAIRGGALTIVQWISQTFLQLVLLSIIMVGQQVMGAASDERAIHTFDDAEAILHEAQQIQAHLAVQDTALEALAARLGVALKDLMEEEESSAAGAVRAKPEPAPGADPAAGLGGA
jgi:hypothetical protein